MYHILPYVEQPALYQLMRISSATDIGSTAGATPVPNLYPPYTTYATTTLPIYMCPSDPSMLNGGLQVSNERLGIWLCFHQLRGQCHGTESDRPAIDPQPYGDGTSNTIMIAERT